MFVALNDRVCFVVRMRFPYSRTYTHKESGRHIHTARQARAYTDVCVYHECVIECVGNTSIWPDKLNSRTTKLSHMRIHCVYMCIAAMHMYTWPTFVRIQTHAHTETLVRIRCRVSDTNTLMCIAAGYRNIYISLLSRINRRRSEKKTSNRLYDCYEICYRLDSLLALSLSLIAIGLSFLFLYLVSRLISPVFGSLIFWIWALILLLVFWLLSKCHFNLLSLHFNAGA